MEFIYDFETLSNDTFRGVVVSLAGLEYDSKRFVDDPYSFMELVSLCKSIKFDVKDQVTNYHRVITKSTLDWWKKQSPEAKKLIKPSPDDVSITELPDWLSQFHKKYSAIYTRGNTFDPIFLKSVLGDVGAVDPFPWYKIRDTRSYLDGLLYGTEINNKFMPPEPKDVGEFIEHVPEHDVALDVLRMQYCIQQVS